MKVIDLRLMISLYTDMTRSFVAIMLGIIGRFLRYLLYLNEVWEDVEDSDIVPGSYAFEHMR